MYVCRSKDWRWSSLLRIHCSCSVGRDIPHSGQLNDTHKKLLNFYTIFSVYIYFWKEWSVFYLPYNGNLWGKISLRGFPECKKQFVPFHHQKFICKRSIISNPFILTMRKTKKVTYYNFRQVLLVQQSEFNDIINTINILSQRINISIQTLTTTVWIHCYNSYC